MNDDANPYQTPQSTDDAPQALTGDSTIRVRRTSSYADRLRAYRIIVDGVERARLDAGESADILVAAGEHSVVAKIDWCGSPTLAICVDVDAITTIECASNLRGFRLFIGVVYVFFLRDQYLTLAQT